MRYWPGRCWNGRRRPSGETRRKVRTSGVSLTMRSTRNVPDQSFGLAVAVTGAGIGPAAVGNEPAGEKDRQHRRKGQRLAHVGLHLHVVMDHTGDGGHISQPVQRPPAFAAQAFDHGVGGGERPAAP